MLFFAPSIFMQLRFGVLNKKAAYTDESGFVSWLVNQPDRMITKKGLVSPTLIHS